MKNAGGGGIFHFAAEFMGSSPSKFFLHSLRYAIPVAAGENSSLGQNSDYCCCQKARITRETLLRKINEIQMLDYII
jgi:hypothetical protein